MCPLDYVDADTWTALEAATFLKRGLAPMPGGLLDQTQSFVRAARFVWAEQSFWRAKLGLTDNG